MPAHAKPTSIQSILENLTNSPDWKEKFNRYSFFEKWEQIVGPLLAKHSRPQKWQDKRLIVRVDNHVWLQELRLLEKEIFQKIKAMAPDFEIEKIQFTLK